jgi:hypothetical protein
MFMQLMNLEGPVYLTKPLAAKSSFSEAEIRTFPGIDLISV